MERSRQVIGLTERLLTHQVLTDMAGADLEVVPRDEQDQEEGQHVKLPVPHCHHKHLQAEGHRGQISAKADTSGGWEDKTNCSSLSPIQRHFQ